MNSIRILLITPGLTPHFGGSAVSEASLSHYLSERCSVKVVGRAGKLDHSFIAAHGLKDVVPYRPFEVLRAFFNPRDPINDWFRESDVMHLNGHWKWENYFFCRLAVRHGVKYVFHPRGMLVLGYRKTRLKRIFNRIIGNYVIRNAAKIIALSEFEVKQFAPHPIRPEQVAVVPNGITPPENFVPPTKAEPPIFLYLGRIEARKNLRFLVEAFHRYCTAGGRGVLHLVGPVERGYDVEIKDCASKLSLSDRVKVLPPAYGDKKWGEMARAAAVIYPTWEEPFGRVPFEALSIGVPVIIPAQSGSAEYLRPYLPEGIYDDKDATALAARMRWMEKTPNLSRDVQVKHASDWVLTRLNWRRIVGEVVNLYEEILGTTASDRSRRPPEFARRSS